MHLDYTRSQWSTGGWIQTPEGSGLVTTVLLSAVFIILLTALLHLDAATGGADAVDDEDLFARYIQGDSSAFEQLFARYSAPLTRMMRRQIRSAEDAAELVQQTFLQLHRARNDFRCGAQLRPWLYTIALNLRCEAVRKGIRRGVTVHEEPEQLERRAPVAADDLTRDETHSQVRRALAELPEGQRTVIALHWFDGLSFAQVAEVVGANVSAVKVRAHRGYQQLRTSLEGTDAPSTIGVAAGKGR